jgi:hypothetical protein
MAIPGPLIDSSLGHLSPIIYEQASYLQASQLLSDFIRNYF